MPLAMLLLLDCLVAKRDTYHHGENTMVFLVQSRINSIKVRAEVIHLDDMDLRLSDKGRLIKVTRLQRGTQQTHTERVRNISCFRGNIKT